MFLRSRGVAKRALVCPDQAQSFSFFLLGSCRIVSSDRNRPRKDSYFLAPGEALVTWTAVSPRESLSPRWASTSSVLAEPFPPPLIRSPLVCPQNTYFSGRSGAGQGPFFSLPPHIFLLSPVKSTPLIRRSKGHHLATEVFKI